MIEKWEKVKLKEVCEIWDNKRIPITQKDRKPGIYPYYGANGVQDYIDDYIFDDELVLLAEDGGNFGSKNKPIAYKVSGKFWVNNHAHVLKNKESLDINYLLYSIMFYDVSKIINGTTRKKLNKTSVEKMDIPFPPLDIQKKIANTLDKANNLMELRKKQLENLELLVKSKFIEMFGDPIENPMGWEVNNIGTYLDLLTDYHANGSYEMLRNNVTMTDKPDFALMIRTTDLENQEYTNNVKYTNESAYEFLTKTKVYGGEIIINKIGSAGKVYKMPFLNRPVSLAMNQFMLRFKESNINNIFIYHLLVNPNIEKRIKDKVRGAVTKTITKEAVKSVEIYIPPIELQNQFADFVEKSEELKEKVQKSLDKSQYLFDSLMSKYFDE